MKSLAHHLILELEGCPEGPLNNRKIVSRIMTEAVEASDATPVQPFFHQLAPQGVSGVVIFSESHFSIHTCYKKGGDAYSVWQGPNRPLQSKSTYS